MATQNAKSPLLALISANKAKSAKTAKFIAGDDGGHDESENDESLVLESKTFSIEDFIAQTRARAEQVTEPKRRGPKPKEGTTQKTTLNMQSALDCIVGAWTLGVEFLAKLMIVSQSSESIEPEAMRKALFENVGLDWLFGSGFNRVFEQVGNVYNYSIGFENGSYKAEKFKNLKALPFAFTSHLRRDIHARGSDNAMNKTKKLYEQVFGLFDSLSQVQKNKLADTIEFVSQVIFYVYSEETQNIIAELTTKQRYELYVALLTDSAGEAISSLIEAQSYTFPETFKEWYARRTPIETIE